MTYTVIRADLKKNRDDIISLWKRNFEVMPEERYAWIYENNPSGTATCWLAKETESDSIVGATALFRRRILINGKEFIAGIGGDFVVDKNHRVLGPALLLQETVVSDYEREKFQILYSFPNKQSEKILLRIGYKILGDILSLTKPLKSYYYLKKYKNFHAATKLVSKSIDLVMKYFSKEKYYRTNDQYLCETPTSFDQRFDIFWDKISSQFPIIGERNSSYLNWRFIQSPHKKYQIFALTHKKNEDVLGYTVFHIVENRAYIEDFLSLDMDKVFDSLLSEFLLFLRKKGIDSATIQCAGPQILINKFKEYGFSIRGSEGKIAIYAPSDFPLFPHLLDKDNWYLLQGDNDI